MSSNPGLTEGILIALVGLVGIVRVIFSLPDAGQIITRMLYILLFIFIAIFLIGIKTIRETKNKL